MRRMRGQHESQPNLEVPDNKYRDVLLRVREELENLYGLLLKEG